MKQSKSLKKLYEFKQLLEEKIALYKKEKDKALYRLYNIPMTVNEWVSCKDDYAEWSKMKDQAEAALVFVKSQIIFEER